MVATVVLQLVGEGMLQLGDTVEHWMPGLVPGGDEITILRSPPSGSVIPAADPAPLASPAALTGQSGGGSGETRRSAARITDPRALRESPAGVHAAADGVGVANLVRIDAKLCG
jgi:hypothetical protein